MKRDRVFRRDRYRCVYCGVEAPAEELTLDHVEARMRGGDESEGNLVTCCGPCNTKKAGAPAWSWLSKQDAARAHFLDAAANCDATQAQPVWPRLIRAIEEAAHKAGPQ